MTPPFSAGDEVIISPLKKRGIIVKITTRRIDVQIGSLRLSVSPEEVQPVPIKKNKQRSRSPQLTIPVKSSRRNSTIPSLDLHGKTVAIAQAELQQFISTSIMSGAEQVDVIHGHGTGKIQAAVHELLAQLSVVKNYSIRAENTGVTRVYF